MSYHIEGGNVCFKELPSRILMREDGYLSAYRLDGVPIADYWYVPESECLKLRTENAKLRELCAGLLTGYECGYGELCKGCTWDGIGDSKTFSCLPRAKARELGIEVGE